MKANIKNKIQELFIEQSGAVLNSFPSLYSKNDVDTVIVKIHKAIDSIIDNEFANGLVDDSVAPKFTWDEIKSIIEQSDINSHIDIDRDTASFSIRYSNELELDDVDVEINKQNYIDELREEFSSFIQRKNIEGNNA